MANKKKRKHRTPIAPPVHSAPGTTPATAAPPPPGPAGVDAPQVDQVVRPAAKAAPRKKTPSSLAAVRKRKSQRRTYTIVAGVVLALIAAIVVPRIMSNRANSAFNALASDAGCGKIQNTADSGSGEHLQPGEDTTYEESPPSHGPHAQATLPQGVYDEPLSEDPSEDVNIYRSVHSLEHGAVIVWYDKLDEDALDELERTVRDEEKVLLVPYPDLKGKIHMAMTAWGKSVSCEKASTKVVDEFVRIYRSARTAPEPNNAI